jgi:hypothetical protein
MAGFNFAPITVQPQQQTSLADMMNIARGAQAYQQAQQLNPLALQQAEQALELSRVTTEKAKRTLEPEVSAKESEAKRLKLEAEKTGVDLNNHYANVARGVYGGLLTDPDFQNGNSSKMVEKLNKAQGFLQELGIPTHNSKMHDQLVDAAKSNPKEAYQLIKNGVQQGGTTTEQFGQLNAPAQYFNTGQTHVPIWQSPYQGGGPGNLPAFDVELPPTTPTISPTGQPGYLGSIHKKGFVPSALPPNAGVGTQDINSVFSDAQGAQNRIGILQNIKDLAAKSFTGVGGARKEYITGLANAIGIDAYELEKANTDILAKNSALLSLAGGNTDLARQLAEGANPNKKMNLEAIKEASNQLIAQERLKQKKAEFLLPYANDPLTLQAKSLEFAKVADPRLLQEMSPEQVKSLKKSMTPDERKEFAEKLSLARQLGLIK